MKKIVIACVTASVCIASLGSCEKNHTCFCTTKIDTVSTHVHDLTFYYLNDAKKACSDYEAQGNAIKAGSTHCHL